MVKDIKTKISELKSLEKDMEISLEEIALLKSVVSDLIRTMIEEENLIDN